MDFASSSREDLVEILNLPKDQDVDGSVLDGLMDDVVTFDATNSTAYVTKIEDALSLAQEYEADIATAQSSSAYSTINVPGDISLTVASPGAAVTVAIQNFDGQIEKIKGWLDPNQQLEKYILTGVIGRSL